MTVNHTTADGAESQVQLAFNQAKDTGKWMVLIASVEDDQVTVRKTSWQFPMNRMSNVLNISRDMLTREAAVDVPDREPLPMASAIDLALQVGTEEAEDE